VPGFATESEWRCRGTGLAKGVGMGWQAAGSPENRRNFACQCRCMCLFESSTTIRVRPQEPRQRGSVE